MSELRHIWLDVMLWVDDEYVKRSVQKKLLTISKVRLIPSLIERGFFENTPNVTDLGIYYSHASSADFSHLHKIETFRLFFGFRKTRYCLTLKFPCNIRDLSLSYCGITPKVLTSVCALLNLEVLRITWCEFRSEEGTYVVEGDTTEGTDVDEEDTAEGTDVDEEDTTEGTDTAEGTDVDEGDTAEGTYVYEGDATEGADVDVWDAAEGDAADGADVDVWDAAEGVTAEGADVDVWDAAAGGLEFASVRVLHLKYLRLKSWRGDESNFPRLSHLFIERCDFREGIPSAIGEITTLQMIEIEKCSASVVESARQIQEVQQVEFDDYSLQLHIIE